MIKKIAKFTLLTGVALLGAAGSAQAQCSSGGYSYSAPIPYGYTSEYYVPQCNAPQYYVPQSTCVQAPVYHYDYQYSQPVQQVCPSTYTYQSPVVRQPTIYVPHRHTTSSRSYSRARHHHH